MRGDAVKGWRTGGVGRQRGEADGVPVVGLVEVEGLGLCLLARAGERWVEEGGW